MARVSADASIAETFSNQAKGRHSGGFQQLIKSNPVFQPAA
jgi:hypothetical protein